MKEGTNMTRKEILDAAEKCVNGQRQEDYGTPEDNFSIIGQLWPAYLGYPVNAQDVAVMMCLFKIGRLASGRGTADTFIDLAGYAACAGEIATKEETENR